MLGGTFLSLITFSKIPTTNSFEDGMAPENVVAQSLRKTVRSSSQRSTTTSVASGRVMARSIAKAATTFAREQAIVTAMS